MCIIAGYAGNKPAAPILIEMLKKTEYIDGGLSTGIATIHEGKLYMRKVLGDVDTLLRETDALDLPGTTGIIHSRTSDSHIAHAHPFLADNGRLALCGNGTSWGTGTPELLEESNRIMSEFAENGADITSAALTLEEFPSSKRFMRNGYTYHVSEPYAQMTAEHLAGLSGDELKSTLASSLKHSLETLPLDVIMAVVHAGIADTITVGTVSRPMSVGFGDGETFMCTVAFGLPEYVQKRSVVFLPPTTIAQITPKGLNILSTAFEGVRVEQLDFRLEKEFRLELEKYLKQGEESSISIYDIPFWSDWDRIWSNPLVDSDKYVLKNSRLKPVASALFEGLWSFHKEGRLRMKVEKRTSSEGKEVKATRFWLED